MTSEPVFLKIKGGWINPTDIMWVQTSKQNDLMLVIGLPGIEKPIYLNEQDSVIVGEYMESHTWSPEEEEDVFSEEEIEDAV